MWAFWLAVIMVALPIALAVWLYEKAANFFRSIRSKSDSCRKGRGNKVFMLDALPENIKKAVIDHNTIHASLGKIQDKELKSAVRRLQKTSAKILDYLEAHPDRASAAMRFVDYYQDRAARLLEQYLELAQSDIQNAEIQDVMERTKETLCGFDAAYEQQFAKIMGNQILDMDAELKVARQILDSDGIAKSPDNGHIIDAEYVEAEKNAGDSKSKWQPKWIGAAAVAVLGVFGAYKFLGKKQ